MAAEATVMVLTAAEAVGAAATVAMAMAATIIAMVGACNNQP